MKAMPRHGSCLSILPLAVVLLATSGCSQTSSHAQGNPPVPPIEFVGQWGAKGDLPGQLDDPAGIATDNLGNVYVTDAGSHFIHKFDARGTPLLSFQEVPLKHPQSIAVDDEGLIYVTDPVRASVFIFMPDDQRHRELRVRARPSAENELSVGVDDDGVIYVLDASTGKVFTYTSRLHFRRAWTPGSEKTHWGPLELGGDQNIWILDSTANRLLRFSGSGQLLAGITPGSANADPKIDGEFAVSRNYVFAMDANGLMLHVLTFDGHVKVDVDLAPQLGQANRLPPPIAVSSRQELFVLDVPECRVYRYRIHL
ncbi:MAG TPA: NHL repeat-containing protein [Candidatus Acidoferrum sp.]|nr:NHL repeat-containing protein [Candidatus Acidoferrum sp.]